MSPNLNPEHAEAVDGILARAGLTLNVEDRERLIRCYPTLRDMAARLRLPEARYAEPALIYPVADER